MKYTKPLERRRVGRPLSFDRAQALRRAMLLFWRHGYEGTSIADLTASMGITPPSLYAAFGDKKRLFFEVVQLYLSGGSVTSDQFIADAATARDAAWGLLEGAAVTFTGAETPAGCLVASAAISGSADIADVQAALAAVRRDIGDQLRRKIKRSIEAGTMPHDADAAALAAHVMAVIQGMSTLARDGAPRETLLAVARTAMRAWPPGTV